jgi:hypothetical protein
VGRIWRAAPPIWCRRRSCWTTYSPEIYCTLHNYHDIVPITGASEGP